MRGSAKTLQHDLTPFHPRVLLHHHPNARRKRRARKDTQRLVEADSRGLRLARQTLPDNLEASGRRLEVHGKSIHRGTVKRRLVLRGKKAFGKAQTTRLHQRNPSRGKGPDPERYQLPDLINA
jgi:hypothetical protein